MKSTHNAIDHLITPHPFLHDLVLLPQDDEEVDNAHMAAFFPNPEAWDTYLRDLQQYRPIAQGSTPTIEAAKSA